LEIAEYAGEGDPNGKRSSGVLAPRPSLLLTCTNCSKRSGPRSRRRSGATWPCLNRGQGIHRHIDDQVRHGPRGGTDERPKRSTPVGPAEIRPWTSPIMPMQVQLPWCRVSPGARQLRGTKFSPVASVISRSRSGYHLPTGPGRQIGATLPQTGALEVSDLWTEDSDQALRGAPPCVRRSRGDQDLLRHSHER
jgi:hypothetical protein